MYKPPLAMYKLTRRATSSGNSEDGHSYRTRNYIFDGDDKFDSCKYGAKKRSVARKPHEDAYDAKRVRVYKKPSAR